MNSLFYLLPLEQSIPSLEVVVKTVEEEKEGWKRGKIGDTEDIYNKKSKARLHGRRGFKIGGLCVDEMELKTSIERIKDNLRNYKSNDAITFSKLGRESCVGYNE